MIHSENTDISDLGLGTVMEFELLGGWGSGLHRFSPALASRLGSKSDCSSGSRNPVGSGFLAQHQKNKTRVSASLEIVGRFAKYFT